MTVKNWLGMPAHPTDGWAFWKTKRPELEKARADYDAIIEAMTGGSVYSEANARKVLEEFVDWARSEAQDAEHYDNSEGV